MPLWLDTTITILIGLTMFVGLFGLVIPIFPGNLVMWVAALIYGFIVGFDLKAVIFLTLITLITIAAMLGDNVLMGAKARDKGASWPSIFLALAAGVVFTFIFPPLGGIIAAPLALFGMEYLRHQDHNKALEVMRALLVGWGWAFLLRFSLGAIVLTLWGIWRLLG